jgi:arylsulfatase A-like enzyme
MKKRATRLSSAPIKPMLMAVLFATAIQAQTNTLLIVGDDMGVDTVGIYKEGTSPAPTPNIDKLASEGVLFRNAYACPSCSPTRATMMTGRYGFRNGVGRAGQAMPLSETTLPEILNQVKYAHALIGKWHLGGNRVANTHPNQTGWGHFAGHLGGFFSSTETYYNWRRVVNGTAATSTVYATTQNVDDALSWIKAQKTGWVCSLNFNAPHTPFHAPPSGLHTYNLAGKRLPRDRLDFFKAMIQAMDTEIGRLLASIDSATMAKTNVIFIGDNGTGGQVSESPFPRAHAKMTLYEGGWNVPLIIKGPAVKTPGREVTALVHTVDLFHTIAEFSGLDANKAVPSTTELDGISLVPYLTNPSQAPLRNFVYSETISNTTHNKAIRNDKYKLIDRQSGSDELYDLSTDAFEAKNLLSGTLTAEQKENYDRLLAEITRLNGDASWFAFGKGCAGKGAVPTLAAASGQRPIYGKTFTTDIGSMQTTVTQCIGILGFDRIALDLTSSGAPGCTLYTGLDVLMPLTASGGKSSWSVFVPPAADLFGFRFYQQVIVFEAGANTHGAILTNAGEGCIERK